MDVGSPPQLWTLFYLRLFYFPSLSRYLVWRGSDLRAECVHPAGDGRMSKEKGRKLWLYGSFSMSQAGDLVAFLGFPGGCLGSDLGLPGGPLHLSAVACGLSS